MHDVLSRPMTAGRDASSRPVSSGTAGVAHRHVAGVVLIAVVRCEAPPGPPASPTSLCNGYVAAPRGQSILVASGEGRAKRSGVWLKCQ